MTMRLLASIGVALLLLASLVYCEEDHVVVVDASNFDAVVSQGNIIVEFYAPWCGHCKKLAPEYKKAAALIKDEKLDVKLAKCDADNKDNKPLAEKYGVKGFPTLKVFRGGSLENPEEYKGGRTAKEIVTEVKKLFGPPSRLITNKEEAADLATSETVLIGAFGKEGPESEVYLKAAEALRPEPMEVGHTFNPKLLEPCKADPNFCTGSLIFLLRAIDKNISKYEGPFEVDSIVEWAIKESTPRLTELVQSSPRHMKKVNAMFQKPEPRLLVYVDGEYKALTDLKKILIEVDESTEDFNVLLIDGTINSKAARFFGLEEKDYPAMVMHEHGTSGKKFVQKKIEIGDVKEFTAKWKAGELEEHLKSEEPPKDDDGPVKELVGKTFKDVFSEKKDVFLEFYASWCGHCKKLAPVYAELGEHFKEKKDMITIAKIDAAANDVPDSRFKIQGFPTLKYVTKGGDVIDYTGDRTLTDMITFINTQLGLQTETPKEKEEEPEKKEKEDDSKEEL